MPGYGPWQVKTYDGSYGGTMDLVQGTLKSDNTVYAQLILDVGPKAVRETARLMGIKTKLDGLPAEGLGGLRLGVSPLEMSNAYATLAAGGMRDDPKAISKVEFADGKSDKLGKPKRKRVFGDGVALEVTKILEQNVKSGTGTKAGIGCPAAGKTGTTDNFNDAWFVGYTPTLASSVWVGYPNALKEMRSVHGVSVAGGTFPAQIWHDYMTTAKGGDCESFPTTANEPVNFSKYSSSSGGYGGGATSGSGGSGGATGDGSYSSPSTGGGGGGGRLQPTPVRGAAAGCAYTQPQPQPLPGRWRWRWRQEGGGNNGGGNSGGGGGGSPDGLSELALIEAIRALLPGPPDRLRRGPGDDAAVVAARPFAVQSIDTVADGVHFSLATHSPADVGHKALATALSDIAAMGAEPGEALVSFVLPPDFDDEDALEIARGIAEVAARHRHRRGRRRRGARTGAQRDRRGRSAGPTARTSSAGATGHSPVTWSA